MDIFVARLSSETTPEDLKELFSQFGSVGTTKIIMDRETGRSKCYGFVEMDDEDDALAAVQSLNEKDFMGKSINVKISQPKNQQRQSGNRHGGGGNRNYNRQGGGGYNREGGGFNREGGNYNRERRSSGGYNRDRFNRE